MKLHHPDFNYGEQQLSFHYISLFQPAIKTSQFVFHTGKDLRLGGFSVQFSLSDSYNAQNLATLLPGLHSREPKYVPNSSVSITHSLVWPHH